MRKLLFIGDIHRDFNNFILKLERIAISSTDLIQVGDFGLGFKWLLDDLDDLDRLNEKLIMMDNHLYVIRGNHDNPKFWSTVKIDFSNITFISDNTVRIFQDNLFFFCGGGLSIDKILRTVDVSWWKNEKIVIPTQEEYNKIIEEFNQPVDVLVTHVPLVDVFDIKNISIINYYMDLDQNLNDELNQERNNLLNLLYMVNPRKWISGHLHISKSIIKDKIQHITLGINEFYELKL